LAVDDVVLLLELGRARAHRGSAYRSARVRFGRVVAGPVAVVAHEALAEFEREQFA
jgi:hypothetical protein